MESVQLLQGGAFKGTMH